MFLGPREGRDEGRLHIGKGHWRQSLKVDCYSEVQNVGTEVGGGEFNFSVGGMTKRKQMTRVLFCKA
jgi:hypothetical protein